MKDYNEQAERRRYLWAHFSVVCSEAEQSVYKAYLGQQKAANSPSQDTMLRKMFGDWDDAYFTSELRDGFDLFTDRVLQRIDREFPELFYLNRCEACDRVVETPKACICGWCGHEWFARRDEQAKIAEDALDAAEQNRREQAGAAKPYPR